MNTMPMTDTSRSRHLVSPDLLPLVDQWASADPSLPLAEARKRLADMMTVAEAHPGVIRETLWIDGPGGRLRLLVYRPDEDRGPRPALLHIHGGGYTKGMPEMGDARNADLVRELGCVVASVAYRLAPEAPYPAALDDCYCALRWLANQSETFGVDPAKLGVVGESAGGGHAAALALLARDRGEIPLAFQWLIFPMIDDRTSAHGPAHLFAGEFVWTDEANRAGWAALLGREPGGELPGPYAAAARTPDLSHLPPALIQTGALDLFVEENIEYARRLIRAGVATELHVYPGAIHGYTMIPDSAAARATRRDALTALAKSLGGASAP